jgi:hypothetical protein
VFWNAFRFSGFKIVQNVRGTLWPEFWCYKPALKTFTKTNFFSGLLWQTMSLRRTSILLVRKSEEGGGCYRQGVRWSNFDIRNPKMGVFLRSTEATPCGGHHLRWKLTARKTPCGHHAHGHGSPVKNRWRLSKFCKKNTKLWPSFYKSVSCKIMGLKSSHWCCLKACFKGYKFCFTTFLVRPSTAETQRSH